MALHKKYGTIVRIAPNEVMVSTPKAFRTIYVVVGMGKNALNYLGETNMEKYRIQRRTTGPAYTENAMKDFETNIDTALKKGVDIMHKRAGESVDLNIFFNFFASDCVSMATFSKCNELIEAGKDNGSIHEVHYTWKYMHWIGYFPLLHRFITWTHHSPTVRSLALKRMVGRLNLFFRRNLSHEGPFALPITELKNRYALKEETFVSKENPQADIAAKLTQLQAEKGVVSWRDTYCLLGYTLPVPSQSNWPVTDSLIQQTQVGINPWILNRDKSLYGDDADVWRPERWLEYTPEQLKQLETYIIFFSTGARSCPGKFLAQAVYTKMIPMLFMNFEWSNTDPKAEERTQCTFSVRYIKLMMQWKERARPE